jgi:hypothetical protein
MNRLHHDGNNKINEIKVKASERAIQDIKDTFGRKSLVTFTSKVQNSVTPRNPVMKRFNNSPIGLTTFQMKLKNSVQ